MLSFLVLITVFNCSSIVNHTTEKDLEVEKLTEKNREAHCKCVGQTTKRASAEIEKSASDSERGRTETN